ncbi:hypothetical protein [Cellulosimicrobium sp. CUA-896]|uniref:hypothetical protein n=1 Tax=Cellulosimicrobium sp. CUA-896 TaxID=1517881 RepID=UPI002100921C|nr:hypothetical protein [Cellulosimicrobium sp. CUA-896]
MTPLERPVALVAEDARASWVLGARDDVAPAVRASGPAQALALVLWRRVAPDHADGLAVEGDAAALRTALAARLTP